MTYEQVRSRAAEVQTELEALAAHDRLTRSQDRQAETLREEMRHIELRHLMLAATGDAPGHTVEGGTPPGDVDRDNGSRGGHGMTGHPVGGNRGELRGRALDLIQRSERSAEWLTHDNLEKLTSLVEREDDSGQDIHARWVLGVGSDEYRSAFLKALRGRQHEWSHEEAAAVDGSRTLERAMGLTDGSGGYLIPAQLDPTIILTSGGSVHPFRQIARQVTATGDVWSGVSSAGVTAEWVAESTQVADASPTLAQPTITLHKYDAFVPYPVEIEGDGQNFLGELTRVMSDGVDQLHATAFATGSGTAQPWGVVQALVGTGSVVTGTTMTSGEVIATQNALPPRFSANARWAAALPIINQIAIMETAAGARLFPGIIENPRTLLGKPLHEASTMDSTIAGGATADYVLLYGDFENYVIADRVGTKAEVVPHIMGAAGRPLLQRGLVLWGRVGSDSVNDAAFRLLNAAT
jgi:HK97 family phage major capsid protein